MRARVNRESGQAIVEMTVGMIMLTAIFAGLLYVVALGTANVDGMIEMRSNAAHQLANGLQTNTPDGRSIVSWDSGNDNINYTADDVATSGGDGSLEPFTSTLTVTPSGGGTALDFNNVVFTRPYIVNNDFDNLPSADLFLTLADLRQFSYRNDDPLRAMNLEDIEETFRVLYNTNSSFSVSDYLYVPSQE